MRESHKVPEIQVCQHMNKVHLRRYVSRKSEFWTPTMVNHVTFLRFCKEQEAIKFIPMEGVFKQKPVISSMLSIFLTSLPSSTIHLIEVFRCLFFNKRLLFPLQVALHFCFQNSSTFFGKAWLNCLMTLSVSCLIICNVAPWFVLLCWGVRCIRRVCSPQVMMKRLSSTHASVLGQKFKVGLKDFVRFNS